MQIAFILNQPPCPVLQETIRKVFPDSNWHICVKMHRDALVLAYSVIMRDACLQAVFEGVDDSSPNIIILIISATLQAEMPRPVSECDGLDALIVQVRAIER